MKNNRHSGGGFDLFTPIAEIFHDFCVMIGNLMIDLIKFGWKKYVLKIVEVKPVERNHLDVRKYTDDPNALGIDTATKRPLLLKDINFKKHSFIVGASGFGKTNLISILQEHDLKNNVPVIYFDPKADLESLMTFKRLVEHHGQKCYIFSEHYHDSIRLNPLLEGSPNQVADRIMRAFDWSEQYYKDVSHRVLLKVLKELRESGEVASLKNIHKVILEKYDSKDISGLMSKIENILESDFGKILDGTQDNLTLSKVRKERACLYIGLSTQGYGETAMSVGKLFLEELLYNSYTTLIENENSHEAQKNPISVYFDEFGSLVTLQFIELQNKCRGAGIQLNLAVQSASDIDRINPDLTKQIIENASNIFIMKQRLDSSATMYSQSIGTFLTKKQTLKTENGQASGSGTERETYEYLVHPNIIKSLKVGQCILLRHDPVQVNLINVRNRREGTLTKKSVQVKDIQTSF